MRVSLGAARLSPRWNAPRQEVLAGSGPSIVDRRKDCQQSVPPQGETAF
jgi:hypothetical protein